LRSRPDRLDELEGAKLETAEARGKHLLLHFERGLVVHCHLGMRGFWRIGAGRRGDPQPASAWLLLATTDVQAAQFGGQVLALRREEELRRDRRLRALGPDILAPGFRADRAVARLREIDQASEIGEALLDQRAVAGIGNVYKCEGCHAARVDPWRPLGALADEELRRLLIETRGLMRDGVENGRAPRRVYRQSGRPCYRCRTPIRSRGQGERNRTTYWCPACQSGGGAR
jgi:endonuclease-8